MPRPQLRSLPLDVEDIQESRILLDMQEELDAAIEKLPEREKRIIRLRYYNGTKSLTLAEVGRRVGLSRERVRQLEHRAKRRIQGWLA